MPDTGSRPPRLGEGVASIGVAAVAILCVPVLMIELTPLQPGIIVIEVAVI